MNAGARSIRTDSVVAVGSKHDEVSQCQGIIRDLNDGRPIPSLSVYDGDVIE